MALQQMIDKKNTFSFIELILSSFYAGQILSAVPVRRLSWLRQNFVKLGQTICIC